jgi:hypothetical protein
MSTINKAASKVKTVKKKNGPCWRGYKKVGTKTKAGKKVNNCIPV